MLLIRDYPSYEQKHNLIEINKKIFKEYPLLNVMKEIRKKAERKICRICHKKSYYISKHGLCKECMMEKIKLARCQIKSKAGPIYEKWKTRLAASLERL